MENLLHLSPSFGTNKDTLRTNDHTQSHSASPLTITPPVLTTPTSSAHKIADKISNTNKECTDQDELPWKPVLPWIPLSRVDKKVLLSTLTRLKDTSCVEVSWKFFNEVLLTDFPPQVFLQRPSLVNVR